MTKSPESNPETGTQRFPVAVVLERRAARSPWVDFTWQATGIAVGQHGDDRTPRLVREEPDVALFVVGGLNLCLHADECESYYYNLVSDNPRAYVVTHGSDPDAAPEPFHISMSFDEAHAYLEGEDEIFAVDVPAEIYRWTEAFVIANYFPQKKTKRKLRDWHAEAGQAGKP